jgi:hypothetical protein
MSCGAKSIAGTGRLSRGHSIGDMMAEPGSREAARWRLTFLVYLERDQVEFTTPPHRLDRSFF